MQSQVSRYIFVYSSARTMIRIQRVWYRDLSSHGTCVFTRGTGERDLHLTIYGGVGYLILGAGGGRFEGFSVVIRIDGYVS